MSINFKEKNIIHLWNEGFVHERGDSASQSDLSAHSFRNPACIMTYKLLKNWPFARNFATKIWRIDGKSVYLRANNVFTCVSIEANFYLF